jgi:hypothetical protein
VCARDRGARCVCVCVYEDRGCLCEKETEGPGVRVCVYEDRGAIAQAQVPTHIHINEWMHSETNSKHASSLRPHTLVA